MRKILPRVLWAVGFAACAWWLAIWSDSPRAAAIILAIWLTVAVVCVETLLHVAEGYQELLSYWKNEARKNGEDS